MKTRHYFFLGVGMALIFTAIIGATVFARPYSYQGSLIDPPMQVDDFELVDQYNRPFQMSEFLESDSQIRAVLVFFGYTYCPDVCPITLIEFKQIKEILGDQAEHLRFVFITVDPERDDPETLRRLMDIYDPSFIGLTGETVQLEEVWHRFGVFQAKQEAGPGGGYLVDHTSRVYVLDRNGDIGLTFGFGMGSEAMAEDLRHLIRQSSR